MSRSSSGPYSSWSKAWVAWLSKGIVEYCMDNSILSFIHVKFGDWAFNLCADDSGEPVNWKMLYIMCPGQIFVLPFLLTLSKLQIYFLCHQRFLSKTVLPEWWFTALIKCTLCSSRWYCLWIICGYKSCVSIDYNTDKEKGHKASHLTWRILCDGSLVVHVIFLSFWMVQCDVHVLWFGLLHKCCL